jgi:hypothetical protein
MAVGYWGRNPYCRIQQEQTPEKIKALLQDKLIAMGRSVYLWLPVEPDTPGAVPCTCDKDTRPGSDFKCLSCYGMRYVPGYLKFMHDTIWFSSAEHASFTLTNTERDTTIKPNRMRLTSNALTGTVETNDKAFSNADGADWEFEAGVFHKMSTDTIVVEFSTDAGGTWTDITAINGANKPTGTGNIRFRITLTRVALTTDSPDFEIIRIRRVAAERQNDATKVRNGYDFEPGQILFLRTWMIEQTLRQLGLGRQTDLSADKAWTAPLDFFDNTISPNTPAAKISDREAGPHPFYEHVLGINQGDRMPMYQGSYNEEFQITFTHQAFFDRRSQDGELYGLVF